MANLPTLYEHYTAGGISAGLSAAQPQFTLNNRNITLYSGALHYFRVPPEYWRDRLRKMRAAGLNTVETYVSWNLHEPEPGKFDFGDGGTDFQEFLNIEKFLKIAQEEDMLAIVRPGPYICAEWNFGGMPSWLLRDKDLKLRTSDAKFVGYVSRFFTALFSILAALQFTKGGPVIAFQIENEYANTDHYDPAYLEALRDIYLSNGVTSLMFTADTPSKGTGGTLPGLLFTANFAGNAWRELDIMRGYQPQNASMVMEFWTGWFDHWTEGHHTRDPTDFKNALTEILDFPASVNFYMFIGGTNWGFMNGANIGDGSTDNGGLQPDTTSYDYDAPLTEAGDYTDKYMIVRDVIKKHNRVPTKQPPLPDEIPRVAYKTIDLTGELKLDELLKNAEHVIKSHNPISMEQLPINNDAGQQNGYIVYRKQNLNIPAGAYLKIEGRVCDTAMILINGVLKSKIIEREADLWEFGNWRAKDASLHLGDDSYENATLDIVVEQFGRNNYGWLNQFNQQKGLWQGNVSINDEYLFDWDITPLEFKKDWVSSLKGWSTPTFPVGPTLYRGVLNVNEKHDTYVDMRGWDKGIIVVNGFVLARHFRVGPQQSAYLPAPLLKEGENEILIFEHFRPDRVVKFLENPLFETIY